MTSMAMTKVRIPNGMTSIPPTCPWSPRRRWHVIAFAPLELELFAQLVERHFLSNCPRGNWGDGLEPLLRRCPMLSLTSRVRSDFRMTQVERESLIRRGIELLQGLVIHHAVFWLPQRVGLLRRRRSLSLIAHKAQSASGLRKVRGRGRRGVQRL